MKSVTIFFALLLSSVSFAQVEQEVDSFGGNAALYEKAKALNPEVESEVVQNRFIKRENRFEFSPEVSGVFNGDAYNRTTNTGINVHYHITPSWSVGVKYNYSFNTLTPEGQNMVEKANQAAAANPKDPQYLFPQIVYPKTETLGMVNWYPIVGKLSFGRYGVAHFDTYLTAGYGQMELSNGTSPASTLGLGLGFWVTPHVTTRLEYRVQQYTAEYYDRTENMLTNIASLQMGWLL
jgi:outer membrane beta-barrel protein